MTSDLIGTAGWSFSFMAENLTSLSNFADRVVQDYLPIIILATMALSTIVLLKDRNFVDFLTVL